MHRRASSRATATPPSSIISAPAPSPIPFDTVDPSGAPQPAYAPHGSPTTLFLQASSTLPMTSNALHDAQRSPPRVRLSLRDLAIARFPRRRRARYPTTIDG
ncbi:hypothetical protein FB107DRAFT_279849 [Schizophyllum commune]